MWSRGGRISRGHVVNDGYYLVRLSVHFSMPRIPAWDGDVQGSDSKDSEP